MKWWLTDSAEDLVAVELATAAERYRRGLEEELARRCEENYPRKDGGDSRPMGATRYFTY